MVTHKKKLISFTDLQNRVRCYNAALITSRVPGRSNVNSVKTGVRYSWALATFWTWNVRENLQYQLQRWLRFIVPLTEVQDSQTKKKKKTPSFRYHAALYTKSCVKDCNHSGSASYWIQARGFKYWKAGSLQLKNHHWRINRKRAYVPQFQSSCLLVVFRFKLVEIWLNFAWHMLIRIIDKTQLNLTWKR
jgi:hypothetical protein